MDKYLAQECVDYIDYLMNILSDNDIEITEQDNTRYGELVRDLEAVIVEKANE